MQEEKNFVLFVSLKEYDSESGSEPGLGELKENYYCISPENAEMLGDIAFLGYIEENGERVGVQLLCDPGYVNASGDGPLLAQIKLGGRYKFAHTERKGGSAVGRIRGYSLKLYEAGHEHEHGHEEGCGCGHDHGHEYEHHHESECSNDCSNCGADCEDRKNRSCGA